MYGGKVEVFFKKNNTKLDVYMNIYVEWKRKLEHIKILKQLHSQTLEM